jgi:hypothetical protein
VFIACICDPQVAGLRNAGQLGRNLVSLSCVGADKLFYFLQREVRSLGVGRYRRGPDLRRASERGSNHPFMCTMGEHGRGWGAPGPEVREPWVPEAEGMGWTRVQ